MLYKDYVKSPEFAQLRHDEITFLRVNWNTESRRKLIKIRNIKDRARQRAEAARLMLQKHPTMFSPQPPKHP